MCGVSFAVRKRNELLTTKTLENAIAKPAHIGFMYPSAARGIAAALAPGLSTELANYATITIGPAPAIAIAGAGPIVIVA